jgi:hypothetical protein
MNRRTLMLLLGAVAVGVLWGGDQLFRNGYEIPKGKLETQLEKLDRDLGKAADAEIDAKIKAKELAFLKDHSLPYDPELAKSAYQDWLLNLVKFHGMENATVDASQPKSIVVKGRVRKGDRVVAREFQFGVRAKTDLSHLTAFLYDFYRAGHLHKITNLSLNPVAGGRAIDVSLSIDALSLEATDRESELAKISWNRLADEDLENYLALARRNVFARGISQSIGQVRLTGVTSDRQGIAQAWFSLGPNRPTAIVEAGKQLAVDTQQLPILEIEAERVSIEVGGEPIWLEIGQEIGQKLKKPDSNVASNDSQ